MLSCFEFAIQMFGDLVVMQVSLSRERKADSLLATTSTRFQGRRYLRLLTAQ
jgi:hypothetical protein